MYFLYVPRDAVRAIGISLPVLLYSQLVVDVSFRRGGVDTRNYLLFAHHAAPIHLYLHLYL